MALSIELWADGQLVEGAEEWWDAVEAALPGDAKTRFPLISRVDPYGQASFAHHELEPLANELIELSTLVPESPRPFLSRLIELCETGSAHTGSELRFIGD